MADTATTISSNIMSDPATTCIWSSWSSSSVSSLILWSPSSIPQLDPELIVFYNPQLELTVAIVCFFFILLVGFIRWQRIGTRRRLEACGLPTVYWTPKFWRYIDEQGEDENHVLSAHKTSSFLSSTTITRILPRMERLKGPYGMYGTVYGIQTSVVHIAHPVPARAILTATSSSPSVSSFADNIDKKITQTRQRYSLSSSSSSAIATSTGASKAPAYNHFKNFCGDGVFTADGDDWKAKRSAVLHHLVKGVTLSSSPAALKLEREANHAADVFRRQVAILEDVQQVSTATTSIRTNIVPLLQRSTVGLIYRYLTNHDPDWAIVPLAIVGDDISRSSIDSESISLCPSASSEEDSTIGQNQSSQPQPQLSESTEILENDMTQSKSQLLESYLQAIVRIRMIILAQSRSVWFSLPRWCYRWFSSLYRDEEDTLQPIRQFARQACDHAQPGSPLHRLANDATGPYCRFSSGITSKDEKLVEKSSPGHPTKDLLDEAITLLFAGQDTSAATLSWTLHLLSLYPTIQQRLADEVTRVVEAEQSQSSVDTQADGLLGPPKKITITRPMINQMVLLDAVIKESMRLYPVAPFVVRRLQHETVIPREGETTASSNKSNDNDYHGLGEDSKDLVLPKGSVACLWIYGLHRNSALWDRPDDFVPDRWIDPDLKDAGPSMGAYMPFAAGPRNCVGQPLAHIILRTLLAQLIYSYQFIDERISASSLEEYSDNDEDETKLSYIRSLRKEMQAGFTVLPSGGVVLNIRNRQH